MKTDKELEMMEIASFDDVVGSNAFKKIEFRTIPLTEQLYHQAEFLLFQPRANCDNERMIRDARAHINILKDAEQLPPIAVIEEHDGFTIIDGNHRVMALYEKGMRTHRALIVERKPYE